MYHYDRAGHLIAETTDTGERIRDYIWAASRPVAQIDVTGGTEHITYLHTDHLATPRQGSAVEGRVVWQWPSDAFGASPANDDPDGDGTAVTVNLRFPGQYYDQETGLHYNWHRYYDPSTGRYITADPLGIIKGEDLNLYRYVENNPIRWIDPLGLLKITLTFGGGLFTLQSGGTKESGVGFDTKGNLCFVVVNCENESTIGPGFAALGGTVGAEKGEFCEGQDISTSDVTIVDLGFGGVGAAPATVDENGKPIGGGKAFGGVGAALGVGSLSCETRTRCTNPFQ